MTRAKITPHYKYTLNGYLLQERMTYINPKREKHLRMISTLILNLKLRNKAVLSEAHEEF